MYKALAPLRSLIRVETYRGAPGFFPKATSFEKLTHGHAESATIIIPVVERSALRKPGVCA
jgi:hypothetical protein